jgi:hypothetical protein
VFACQVPVMSKYMYKTIYVNSNSTHLIKWVGFFNFNPLISCLVRIMFAGPMKNCQP